MSHRYEMYNVANTHWNNYIKITINLSNIISFFFLPFPLLSFLPPSLNFLPFLFSSRMWWGYCQWLTHQKKCPNACHFQACWSNFPLPASANSPQGLYWVFKACFTNLCGRPDGIKEFKLLRSSSQQMTVLLSLKWDNFGKCAAEKATCS